MTDHTDSYAREEAAKANAHIAAHITHCQQLREDDHRMWQDISRRIDHVCHKIDELRTGTWDWRQHAYSALFGGMAAFIVLILSILGWLLVNDVPWK